MAEGSGTQDTVRENLPNALLSWARMTTGRGRGSATRLDATGELKKDATAHLPVTRGTLLGGWGWGEEDGRRSTDGGGGGRGAGPPLHSSEEEAWVRA